LQNSDELWLVDLRLQELIYLVHSSSADLGIEQARHVGKR
jgi:hypothetical protein